MTDKTQKQFNEALSKAIITHKKRRLFTARTAKADGTLYVTQSDGTRKPGYVWARVNFGGASAAEMVVRCRKVIRLPNLWVTVGFSDIDDELEVIEEDPTLGIAMAGDRSLNVPDHAAQHDRFGGDPLYLNGLLFKPFLVTPSDANDLNVYLHPFYYKYVDQNKYWPGGEVDLTSYVPSSGQDCVIVGLDPATNTAVVIETGLADAFLNPSLNNIPFDRLDVAAVQVDPYWPSAAVRLYATQTSVDARDIWFDLRWLYSGGYYGDNIYAGGLLLVNNDYPSTPPTGYTLIYAASDGIHYVDDEGTDTGPLGTGGGTGGASELDDLDDVTITGAAEDDILRRGSSMWENHAIAEDRLVGRVAGGHVTGLTGAQAATIIDIPQQTLTVVNNSGGTVAAGDVVLLQYDGTDGYEAVTTTTAAAPGIWAVVETGGADGADITVYRRGTGITVNYTGSAPSAGDYLTTSTTAGAAVGRTTMHANIFAVCIANGAGGQVEATLLCNTLFVPNVASQRIIGVSGHADTDFVATINGAPNATTVVYNAPSSGNENVIDPDAATHLGRMVLFNSTRGTERLIVDTNTGTNTITTENTADAWANGDTITIRSQTVTGVGPPYMIDVDLSTAPASDIDPLARAMLIKVTEQETGTIVSGFSYTVTHPYETFNNNKQITVLAQLASQYIAVHSIQTLIQQRFCWRADANGAATCGSYMDSLGYWVAAP